MKQLSTLICGAFIALAVFMDAPAGAADVAPPPASRFSLPTIVCTPQQCSGWYVGGNIMGVGSNANFISNGIGGSIFAGGGMLGIDGGYQVWNGTLFAAAEVSAEYDAGSTAVNLGQKSRYFFSEMVKFGGSISSIFASNQMAPSQGPITIPQQLAASMISPYFQAGIVQRPWGQGWATGAGAQFVVGQGLNLDVSYIYATYANSTTSPTSSTPSENFVKIAIRRMF